MCHCNFKHNSKNWHWFDRLRHRTHRPLPKLICPMQRVRKKTLFRRFFALCHKICINARDCKINVFRYCAAHPDRLQRQQQGLFLIFLNFDTALPGHFEHLSGRIALSVPPDDRGVIPVILQGACPENLA